MTISTFRSAQPARLFVSKTVKSVAITDFSRTLRLFIQWMNRRKSVLRDKQASRLGSGRLKAYYHLTKPGIIYGNLLAAIAGFLFASKGIINWELLLGFSIGLSLVIASACVLNNILDREIDQKMARTKHRPLVTGIISIEQAFVYGTLLGAAGFWLLVFFTNWLCVALGAAALFLYVVVYGIAKRKSVHGTLVGAIPGAIPPIAGYGAVTNTMDTAALLLLLAMIGWQMAHFYAIALYRQKEYAAAGIPLLPIKKGVEATKKQILVYIVVFVIASLLLTYFGYAGVVFAIGILLTGLVWLVKARRGFKAKNPEKWARGMFVFSLKALLLFCLLLSVEAWVR